MQSSNSSTKGNSPAVTYADKIDKIAPRLRTVLLNLKGLLHETNVEAISEIAQLSDPDIISSSELLKRLGHIDDVFYKSLPVNELSRKTSCVHILSTFRKCLTHKSASMSETERLERIAHAMETLLKLYDMKELPKELQNTGIETLAKDWLTVQDITTSPALQCIRSALWLTIQNTESEIDSARRTLLLFRPNTMMIDEGTFSTEKFIESIKEKDEVFNKLSMSQRLYYLYSLYTSTSEDDTESLCRIQDKIDQFFIDKNTNNEAGGSKDKKEQGYVMEQLLNINDHMKDAQDGGTDAASIIMPVMNMAGKFTAKLGDEQEKRAFLEQNRKDLIPLYQKLKDEPLAVEMMKQAKQILFPNQPDFALDQIFK